MPATDEKEIVSPGQSEPAAEVSSEANSSEEAPGPSGLVTLYAWATKPGQGGRICHVGRGAQPRVPSKPNLWNSEKKRQLCIAVLKVYTQHFNIKVIWNLTAFSLEVTEECKQSD